MERGEGLLIEGLHQQPQQILPEDIPAVFFQEPLTQLFIAEGQTQKLCSRAAPGLCPPPKRIPPPLLSKPKHPLPPALLVPTFLPVQFLKAVLPSCHAGVPGGLLSA